MTALKETKHALKIGLTKGSKKPPDYKTFQEQLGWIPLDTIKKTFKATA